MIVWCELSILKQKLYIGGKHIEAMLEPTRNKGKTNYEPIVNSAFSTIHWHQAILPRAGEAQTRLSPTHCTSSPNNIASLHANATAIIINFPDTRYVFPLATK